MANHMNVELVRDIMGRDSEEAAYPNSLIPKLDNDGLATVGPSADSHVERMGFWQRQFKTDITRGQKKFDWTFGVILPVICFYFDPIVFKNGFADNDQAILGKFAIYAYALSFAAIMANMAWLLWGQRLKWLNAPLSGLLGTSSLAACAIGIVLFPFSILGLFFMFIGALGFTPLLTSFVLLRNSIRAFGAAKLSLEKDLSINSFVLSAVATAVIPYLISLLYFNY
jgi:hypothetical protein